MLLTKTRVSDFKCIDDSGLVPIDPEITVMVGQNESGKTAFLQALNKARSTDPAAKYDITEDYPRKTLNDYLRRHEANPAVVAELTYKLSPGEVAEINTGLGVKVISEGFTFTQSMRYGGGSTISMTVPERPYIQHILKGVELPSEVANGAKEAISLRQLIEALEGGDLNSGAQEFRDGLKDRFGRAPDTWAVLEWHVWTTYINPRIPKFAYFDDYRLLPGKVNLRVLQQKVAKGTVEGDEQTVLALLRMANVDLDELMAERAYEEVKARLEGLSNSITDRIFKYWTQNQDLEVQFDIREDSTDDPPFDDGPNLYIRIRNPRHRVTVPFSQRSKGFIWFFSFLVWFDSVKEQEGTESELILLLDEPGLSLHGLAQEDLLRYIDSLAERHQVVYTTHSPFMVRSDRLHQVRTVEDRRGEGTKVSDNVGGSNAKTLFPLQAALGYDIAQNLFISKRNLLVEGPADLVYLKYFSNQLDEKGRTGLRDDVTIVPAGGLDKVVTFVALLGGNELEMAVLHDTTGKPDQRIASALRDKLIRDRQVLNYGMFTSNGKGPKASDSLAADVEDLLSPALYLKVFNEAFEKELGGRTITEADLPQGDRIVERIERHLRDAKIKLRPTGGYNHYRVANHLASSKAKVDAATLNRFERLFGAVNQLYSN